MVKPFKIAARQIGRHCINPGFGEPFAEESRLAGTGSGRKPVQIDHSHLLSFPELPERPVLEGILR